MLNSDYSLLDRFIHRVALQSKAVAEMSFDMDNASVKKSENPFPDNHVFISGLARSGTTILMRSLYETGQFKSLTYEDMPFVLMPNVWKKISHRKASTELKERAHKDGIMVGFDSPEAFEEVFWRVFSGKDYIFSDRLRIQRADDELLKKFKDYVDNILMSGDPKTQTRYLSKNNNNVLRFKYLNKIMPGSHIVIPFREPLQHAISLLNQHTHFSKIQSEDKFSLEYMSWLGHFEFGLNQKPFFLGDEKIFNDLANYPKTDINFWLLSWKNYYQYVSGLNTTSTIFFNYERFCEDQQAQLYVLFEKLNIKDNKVQLAPFTLATKNIDGVERGILNECLSIYTKLDERSQS